MDKPLIDPENLPMWTASAFVLALVALAVGFFAIHQNNVVVLGTQTEVLALNKKIEAMKSANQAPAAIAAAPQPAEPQAEPKK